MHANTKSTITAAPNSVLVNPPQNQYGGGHLLTWPVTLSSAPCAESEKLGACWWALPELRSVPLDLFHERGADTPNEPNLVRCHGRKPLVRSDPARKKCPDCPITEATILKPQIPTGFALCVVALSASAGPAKVKMPIACYCGIGNRGSTAVGCGTALRDGGETQRTQGDWQAGRRIIACCATSHRKERIKLSAAR